MKRSPLLLTAILLSLYQTGTAYAGTLTARVVVEDSQKPLAEAVVTARPLSFSAPLRPGRQTLIDQVDKEFVNQTTLIYAGDSINFPNKDNIDHHVYSFSAPKQFELPLYRDMPDHPILFDKPGVVKLGCNIHDWMVGYIYVADTPYAAMTDATGQVTIEDLPDGEYEVRVWHAQLKPTEQETAQKIQISAGDTAVEWSVALKRLFRPRRSPLSIGSDY